jgi:hypothetical protein
MDAAQTGHEDRSQEKRSQEKRNKRNRTINIYITHMNIETYKGHKDWSPELNMQTYAAIAEDPNILV